MKSHDLIGSSREFLTVLDEVKMVAPADCAVLIQGETGTGKELIARAIHDSSARRNNRFVAINCAAIPSALLESELFGHERGAFTGAVAQRIGRFQNAHQGTLFLDELTEFPLELQAKLLRVLQERQIERLGASHSVPIDVRILAATNQDLATLVQDGKFRADLYYRLSVFPITLPPLRDRQEDVELLLEHFVMRYCRETGKGVKRIEKSTLQLLKAYDWPGNIRELQNIVQRAVIVAKTEALYVDEKWLRQSPSTLGNARNGRSLLAHQEVEMIEAALRKSDGRISGPSGAARKLGIPRQTLESKIKRFGIGKYGSRIDSAIPLRTVAIGA